MRDLDLNSSKVYQILAAMTTAERERFGEFMRSPYFNTRPQLVDLFDILMDTFSEKQRDKTPLKSDAYRLLFKLKKEGFEYTTKMDSHLRKLLSDLKGLADRFLGVEGFLARDSNSMPYVCAAYQRMELGRHFELHMEEALEGMPLAHADAPQLVQRHLLETLEYEFLVNNRKWDAVASFPGEGLMLFYHVERYKQLCEYVLFRRLVDKDIPISIGTILPNVIPAALLDQFPLAVFYTQFYLLLTEDKGDLKRLSQLVKDLCKTMDHEECLRMYAYLQNYCAGKINRGEDHLNTLLIELNLGRLAIEKTIPGSELINLVHAAGRIKDAESAKRLFEDGRKKLVNDPEGSVEQYLEAYIAYVDGAFPVARKQLSGLNANDPSLERHIRTLEIKAWWEDVEEDDEFTLNKIHNFLRQLKRGSDLPTARRKIQEDRFKFAAKIIKARYQPDMLQKLLVEIRTTTLADRDYMESRILAYLEK
jgi:hypothetical protein